MKELPVMAMLLLLSLTAVSDSLWPLGLRHARPPCLFHHPSECAQVHVHWIGDAIQPSNPLMPSSPFTLNLCQHQGLFQWVNCSHPVTKVLELQLQYLSFQWVFRVDFPEDWLVWSPSCPRDSQASSPVPHQFFGSLPSKRVAWSTEVHGVTKSWTWLSDYHSLIHWQWPIIKMFSIIS